MTEQSDFDALVEEFYPVWFRYHPDLALSLDVDGFGSRLPAADDDEISALGVWLENLIVELAEIDYTALDPDRQLDLRLLSNAAQVELRELLQRDWRHLDPTRFLPVREIFQLTLHPPRELREALVTLLQAVPAYLRQARGQLQDMAELIAPEMIGVAMDEAEAGIAYIRALADSVWLRHHCPGCVEIGSYCDTAAESIRTYIEVLRQDIAPRARGGMGCGESHYLFLLEQRHCLDLPPEGLRTYLEALYRDTFRLLEAQANALGIAGEPGFVLAYLERQPAIRGEARLQAYREEANRLRELVRGHGLLTPPEESFRILERPLCPRPDRCDSGYMEQPGRRGGLFFISGAAAEGETAAEPLALVRGHCIRQAWTGAHLLSFPGGERSRTLPRRLAPAAAFATAWDLYIHQFLVGTGYYDEDDRLVQLLQQLRAVQLALLDLDLHLGRVTTAQALARLGELEPDPARAAAALASLARNPADALAGVVGWLLLHQTRELLQDSDDFSSGEFHDRLLHEGPVPPALLIPHLFGETLWERVRDELSI